MRPDFGFHQDAEARAVFVEKLRHIIGTVVGKVAALRVGKQFFRRFAPRRRHLGNQQRRVGKAAAQAANERFGGARFAHRYGVQPDGVLQRCGMRTAEAFVPIVEIGGVFDGAAAEVAADKRRGDLPKGAVQQGKQCHVRRPSEKALL